MNRPTGEITYMAIFTALLIGGQEALSFLPGVEIVTVLFCCYAFTFGIRRSMTVATMFCLLRCFLHGFYPSVIIEYLIYYNFLVCVFGVLGKVLYRKAKKSVWLVVCTLTAVVCSACFTLLDDVITPFYYMLDEASRTAYFQASLPVMAMQCLCTFITVGVLFLPLTKLLRRVARRSKMDINGGHKSSHVA